MLVTNHGYREQDNIVNSTIYRVTQKSVILVDMAITPLLSFKIGAEMAKKLT